MRRRASWGFDMFLAAGLLIMLLGREAGAAPRYDVPAAMDFACDVLEYECAGIPLPAVEHVEGLLDRTGNYGEYNGGAAIQLDASVVRHADEDFVQTTVVHEVTHYLDVYLGVYRDAHSRTQWCEAERRAWRVDNAYTTFISRGDLSDFGWAKRYGCS